MKFGSANRALKNIFSTPLTHRDKANTPMYQQN